MKRKAVLALTMLVVIAFASVAMSARTYSQKATKQVGGSTGDSVTAAADTSGAMSINAEATSWWVFCANDSNAAYTVQVSENRTYWYTIDLDTVSTGTAEATAAFTQYQGQFVRVIQDMIPAGGAAYGAAWLQYTK